jgi:outer membrane protein TolC
MRKELAFLFVGWAVSTGCTSALERSGFGDYETAKRERRELRRKVEARGGEGAGGRRGRDGLSGLDGSSTVDDYLAYAALRNPALEAAFRRWKGALERIPQARSIPDPVFSYTYYIQHVETRVGPQRHRFTLSQRIPFFTKLTTKADAAGYGAIAARRRFEALKLNLFFKVKKALYEYAFLKRRLDITDAHLQIVTNMERLARRLYSVNRVAHSAVIKAQVEMGRLENDVESLRRLRRPVAAELDALLDRRAGEPLEWPQRLHTPAVDLSLDELRESLVARNPEVKHAESRVRQRTELESNARQQLWPDLMIQIGVIETGRAVMPDVAGSGKDPVMATVALTIPIWFGKHTAAIREAEAKRLAARSEKREKVNRLLAELTRAHFDYRDGRRRIQLYESTLVPKARQALQVVQQEMIAGEASFLDVLDAERALLRFQLELEKARRDVRIAVARLEMLSGRRLGEVTNAGPSRAGRGGDERKRDDGAR